MLIPITTDAHSIGALGYAELGVAQARRAWLTKEQVLNTRPWREIAKLRSERRFREDGAARARVGRVVPRAACASCPVLVAGRAGRDPRARCRRRRPSEPEPFSARARATSTRSSCRGSRTGRARASSPTSRRPASEPGILAELLIAGLNQVGILWRASPALQELEELTLDWLRQLARPARASLHGHIEDTASTGVLAAVDRCALAATPTAACSCARSTHPWARRLRVCSGSSCGRCPPTTSSACGRS